LPFLTLNGSTLNIGAVTELRDRKLPSPIPSNGSSSPLKSLQILPTSVHRPNQNP
jgi:hypothetical protein